MLIGVVAMTKLQQVLVGHYGLPLTPQQAFDLQQHGANSRTWRVISDALFGTHIALENDHW